MNSSLKNWYLCKKTVREGSEKTVPLEFARCQASIICHGVLSEAWKNSLNYVTDGSPFELCIGKVTTPFNMVIDHCLVGMKVGETYKVWLKADGSMFEDLTDTRKLELLQVLAKEGANQNEGSLNDMSKMKSSIAIIELTLLSITEQGKDIFLLTSEEKLAIAKLLKEAGSHLYKVHVDFSFMLFSRALKYAMCVEDNIDTDTFEDVRLIKTQCYLNLAACQLQKDAFAFVIQNCSKALDLDLNNVKGLYRRAQAHAKIGDFENAQLDLVKALEQEPNNKMLQSFLRDVKQKYHEQHQTLATAMSKMFK